MRRRGGANAAVIEVTTPLSDTIFLQFEFANGLWLSAKRALLETSANGIAIALKEGVDFVCRATAGVMAPAIGVRLQDDKGITAACIRSAQAVVCSDTTTDERVNAAACKELGIASIVVVPIIDGETVIGVVEALSDRPGALGAAEQGVLEKIAHEIRGWAPDQATTVDANAMDTPDEPAMMIGNEAYEEALTEAEDFRSDAESYAERGDGKRGPLNFAAISEAVVVFALIVALVIIIVRIRPYEANASDQIPAELSRLPLRRAAFLDLLTGIPTTTRDDSTSLPRKTSKSASMKMNAGTIRELKASAQAGDASAQVRLASALAHGAGVAADPVSAEAWYIVAHLGGATAATTDMQSLSRRLSNAQIAAVRERLATMYWKGIGVKKDLTSAYSWLILAEAAGAHNIGARKLRLAREMAPSQITDANLRAQQWLEQHHQLIALDGK